MSQSAVTVQIYEYQVYSRIRGLWTACERNQYVDKDSQLPSRAPCDFTLPSEDWIWTSKWTVITVDGMTDPNGWEYASRISRFSLSSRKPKNELTMSSRYRRRQWLRIMDRDRRIIDVPEVLKRVQSGLGSIHCARIKMEQLIRREPEIVSTAEMIELVMNLKKNICDVLASIDQVNNARGNQHQPEQHKPHYGAALKKLRNDAHKEEVQYL